MRRIKKNTKNKKVILDSAILEPVKCIDIELAIMRQFNFRQNLIVPNITNQMGIVAFETDMFVLTKSNLAYGFEIKTSKSDLKADFKKIQHTKLNEIIKKKSGMEHYYGKFKYFYYAVPEQLKDYALSLIPDFCGLWCLKKVKINNVINFYFYEVRKPKKLFDYKWTTAQRYEIARLGTMRIYNLKNNIYNLN